MERMKRTERSVEVTIDRAGAPVARITPLAGRANRTAVGSLAGQLDISGDWDSSQTNAEIAADFGPTSDAEVVHAQECYRLHRRD